MIAGRACDVGVFWRMPKPRPLAADDPFLWLPRDYFAHADMGEVFPDYDGKFIEADMGCGDGTFLLEMAKEHPERRYLAVERLLGRVRKVCRRLRGANVSNARVLRLESQYALTHLLPENSIDRLHFLFPDPWPKARHEYRRLFSEPFLRVVGKVLKPGGEMLFKTDHDDYFERAEGVIAECGERIGATVLPWEEGDFFYPTTDFEQQWLDMGKSIDRMRLQFGSR